MTRVTLTVANPKDPKRQIKDEFLVDSGAAFTVLPADLVAKLNGKEIPSPVVLGKKTTASYWEF